MYSNSPISVSFPSASVLFFLTISPLPFMFYFQKMTLLNLIMAACLCLGVQLFTRAWELTSGYILTFLSPSDKASSSPPPSFCVSVWPMEARRGCYIPQIGVTSGCESLFGCWELNLSPSSRIPLDILKSLFGKNQFLEKEQLLETQIRSCLGYVDYPIPSLTVFILLCTQEQYSVPCYQRSALYPKVVGTMETHQS